jgi:surface protein
MHIVYGDGDEGLQLKLYHNGMPVDSYVDKVEPISLFVGETLDMKGTANIAALSNWTIILRNSTGDIVNNSLCFGNTPVVDDIFCQWNTSKYCANEECGNYTLTLIAINSSGDFSVNLENLTIDNLPPLVDIDTELIEGDASYWKATANITDTYLQRVDSFIFNGTQLIRGWEYMCNETQCDWSGSGLFENEWYGENYSLGGTEVSAYNPGMSFPDFEGQDQSFIFIPGCLSMDGNAEDYECGGTCDSGLCSDYRWWGVYNTTNTEPGQESFPFIGLVNDNQCDETGCYLNNSIIQNGTTKFLPQIDYLNMSIGEWDTENSSLEATLYFVNTSSNLELGFDILEEGNFTFAFRAQDYWWTMMGAVTDYINLGQILPDAELHTDNMNQGNINGTGYSFISGLYNITGYANSTNLSNWTIQLSNSSGSVNDSLCFGDEAVNGTFCQLNTTKYCAGECENYTLFLNVSDNNGNNNFYSIHDIAIDNLAPRISVFSVDTSNPNEVVARASINESYINEVRAYLFNSTNNATVMEWGRFCGEGQGDACNTILQGNFNRSWSRRIFSINNSQVPVSNKFGFNNLPEGTATVTVPGCFDADEDGNFDCGGTCSNQSICSTYRWWLVYNDSQGDENKTLLGLVSEELGNNGYNVSTDLINNGTSKFQVQADKLNFSSGEWYYENLTNITLYFIGNSSNLNISYENAGEENFIFAFEAEDYMGQTVLSPQGFILETNSPEVINITYPLNSTNYYQNVSNLNYTVSGSDLKSCWYSTNNGGTNSSAVTAGQNFTISATEGSNSWTVYCSETSTAPIGGFPSAHYPQGKGVNLWSYHFTINGQNASTGDLIEAYNQTGSVVGEFTVDADEGIYGFMPVDGLNGDVIHFSVIDISTNLLYNVSKSYTMSGAGWQYDSVEFDFGDINYSEGNQSSASVTFNQDTTPPSSRFISLWNTSATTGDSSDYNQVMLPLEEGGTYDFLVYWGDGSVDEITSWNDADRIHDYGAEGVYQINITGTIVGWRINNAGDRLKLSEIQQWGKLNLGNNASYFAGASNLKITATDVLNLTGTTDLSNSFAGCYNLTSVPSMDDWNTSSVSNMESMFGGAILFNQDIGSWDTSSVTTMRKMFCSAYDFNQNLSNWNTHNVINMNLMFGDDCGPGTGDLAFNGNISNWDTSKVTDMSGMFSRATSFNQPIGNWNTSKVITMSGMFYNATSFNQNISSWDVSSVSDMTSMFEGTTLSSANYNSLLNGWAAEEVHNSITFNAGNSKYTSAALLSRNHLTATHSWTISDGGLEGNGCLVCNATCSPCGGGCVATDLNNMFNGITDFDTVVGNISGWNTSCITNMAGMFTNSDFNQSIGNWNTSSVTNMAAMFYGAYSFNQPIGNWNTSKVSDMNSMFSGASDFNQPIGNWDVSSVSDMNNMFYYTSSFNQPIGNWNTSKVTNMNYMFNGATSFNQSLNNWDTSSVNNMVNMFNSATSFNQNISNWDTSKVTDIASMFYGASAFNQPIGNWNTSSVTNMDGMFRDAGSFNQPIGNWDTSKVITMTYIFRGAGSFNQPIGNWNISKITDMNQMFYGATSFNQSIGNWDTRGVTNMGSVFYGAASFNQDISSWNISKATTMSNMFKNANLSFSNYDALLNGWASQSVKNSVTFNAGTSKYSSAGVASRAHLTGTHSWSITDGGFISINITFVSPTTAAGEHIQNFITANVSVANSSAIANLTTFLYNGSGLIRQNSSTSSIFFWNITGLAYGNYSLNASVIDSAGLTNQTETFNINLKQPDTTAPTVDIISPASGTTYTSSTVSISISLNEAGHCIYNIANGANYTLTANGANTSFTGTSASLSNGDYVLYAYCNDSAGNNASSSSSFTINVQTVSNGGGGSGTTPELWKKTYSVNESQSASGFNQVFSNKERAKFKVHNEEHYVGVNSLTSQTATINVSSIPQQKTLTVGEEWKVEVNGDSIYDFYIKLNSIINNKANLTIKTIQELIPQEESETNNQTTTGSEGSETADSGSENENVGEQQTTVNEKNAPSLKLVIIILVAALVLVILMLIILHKKKKKRAEYYYAYSSYY